MTGFTKGVIGGYETRVCPRCGAELYADMSVCYGCLYDFARDAARPRLPEPPGIPPEPPAGGPDETLDLADGETCSTREVGMLVRTPSVDVWVSVPSRGVTVGRDDSNDVVLHSRAVSRRHLRLAPTPDGMEASDLGATNPTRYRGRDVRGSVIVPYGDSVDVCGCVLTMTGPCLQEPCRET